MNVDLIVLPLAVVLLWIPAVAFASREVKDKLRQATRRHHDGFGSLMRSAVNWFDLVRAGGGAWLLGRFLLDVPSGQEEMAKVYLLAYLLALVVGVVAQCFILGNPLRIAGPVFYLTGLTLAVSGPKIAAFALILSFTCGLMLRRVSLTFLFLPVALLMFGKIFGQLGIPVALNAALAGLPLFLAFAFGVRLSYVRRPAAHAAPTESEEEITSETTASAEESAESTPAPRAL